jgi:exopolysaccharide biosynthesis polyprenyl glycosylphosphotransferase
VFSLQPAERADEALEDLPRFGWGRLQAKRAALRPRAVANRYGPRDAAVRRLLALADLVGLTTAFGVEQLLIGGHGDHLLWGLATLPAWIVVFKAYGLYDRDIKRISHTSLDDLPWIFHAVLLGCLLLFAFYRFTTPLNLDLSDLAVFGGSAIIALTGMRAIARRLAVRALGHERVALVGDGDEIAALAQKMRAHPEYGVEPVGLVSPAGSATVVADLPFLGQIESFDLERAARAHGVERIVVAHEHFGEGAMLELLRNCRQLGVKVSVIPQLFYALGPSVEVDDVEGLTVLGINPPVLPRSSRFLKRCMDLAGSIALLLIAAPLLALIALAIKLDSGGPVFFRQQRVGRWGRRFRVVKFRTMVPDAEKRREALLKRSTDPGWLLLDDDPRVTRIGSFLRRSSLDELPQLWNVVKGEMSLVGPRPLPESEHSQLYGWRETRTDLTPGLTGLWQVLGRTTIPFEEMVKLDYLYVTNWSLWTDVRLILQTLPAVLSSRGAN